MLTARLQGLRGLSSTRPLHRPLRPSKQLDNLSQTPSTRLFTQNHPLLLLLSRQNVLRPQLPFLAQPNGMRPASPMLQGQLARLLSTETQTYVRRQTFLAFKWTAVGWTMFMLLAVAYYGWQSELVEREHPSPAEWSFYTRAAFRSAFAKMDPEFSKIGITDWAQVGTDFRHCVERLENPEVDGKGLRDAAAAEEGDDTVTMIPGVGRSGYDITGKSYTWRTGYFQVLMGCAKAAEYLDDMVRDKTRKLVFPKDVMIGPSNPSPRPVTPNMEAAPLEENCDRPYAPPETFYLRIMTGKGFYTAQKLDAALAYANWLEIKGAHSTAEDMYQWAMDIASAPVLDSASSLGSKQHDTKALPASAVTPNLLRANTALATYHARSGRLALALPMYLSILQARRSVTASPSSINRSSQDERSWFQKLIGIFIRPSAFPLDEDLGDEPLSEMPQSELDCAESEIMLYIGEILFATASARSDEGLGWTKQAVELARKGARDQQRGQPGSKKCRDCLNMGVNNWSAMVARLIQVEEQEKIKKRDSWSESVKGWFHAKQDSNGASVWKSEAETVALLKAELLRQGVMDYMGNASAPGSKWIG